MGIEAATARDLTVESPLPAPPKKPDLKVISQPQNHGREKITSFIPFEDDPNPNGMFITKGGVARPVERTARNWHTFTHIAQAGQESYQVVYFRSMEVVHLLDNYVQQTQLGNRIPLVVWDTEGQCLEDLVALDQVEDKHNRHVVTFETHPTNEQVAPQFEMRIDDIHFVLNALGPFVWRGDQA